MTAVLLAFLLGCAVGAGVALVGGALAAADARDEYQLPPTWRPRQ